MKEKVKIEKLNGIELLKLIYEEVKNNKKDLNEKLDIIYKELNEKIDSSYKELNEKIDDTKNILATEIVEEFENFSVIVEKLINNLNNKLDNEIEERKIDVYKVKDFNKIIINDIRSRISILEEETEKYNLN